MGDEKTDETKNPDIFGTQYRTLGRTACGNQ